MRGFGSYKRPWRQSKGRRTTIVALSIAAAIGLAACGQEEQPGLGAGVAVPTTVATTTTTVATTTTASTIDFDRPITQGTDPLIEEAGPTDVAALIADIRGQTANVPTQVQRLAPFLDLDVAPIAQITGLDVTLSPEDEDKDGHPVLVSVRFRAPEAGPDLVKVIEDQFDGLAWNLNDLTASDVDGLTVTELVFREPGYRPEDKEFQASVTAEPSSTSVELNYLVLAEQDEVADEEGVTYYDRLSAWQDDLELIRVAELTEVGVETTDEAGIVFARYEIDAEDETEAISRLTQAIARSSYELLGASIDDPPTSGPLRLVDEAGDVVVMIEISPAAGDETFTVEAVHEFELTALD